MPQPETDRPARTLRAVTLAVLFAVGSVPVLAGSELTPLGPKAPRRAQAATSTAGGACAGLKDYEVVRSATDLALCSDGNIVTGGTCSGIDGGGPVATGAGWECTGGERATAICAAVCSRLEAAAGACCESGLCTEATFDDCAASGGSYEGDGVLCSDDLCAGRGACCIAADPLCVDDVTEAECTGMGGTYVGDDIACDEDPAAVCFE